MNLLDLKCLSIEAHIGDAVWTSMLSGWAEGIRIYRVSDVLYFPAYGIQVCHGFSPHEAVLYESHLKLGQRRVPREQAIVDLAEVTTEARDVCILGNMCARTFGHWAEELLKVVLLEHSGFDGNYVLSPGLPPICEESLTMLDISPERVIVAAEPVRYRCAYYTTIIHHFFANRYPMVFLHLRDRLHGAVSGIAGQGERIWLDRGKSARRKQEIVNAEEVEEFCSAHGISVIDFGELTFAEQIASDRDMRVLMGPHGSGFVHCGFMRSRQNVIEVFSPEYVNPSVIQLSQALQHRYNQIVPTNQPNWRYSHGLNVFVDMDHLELVFSSLDR